MRLYPAQPVPSSNSLALSRIFSRAAAPRTARGERSAVPGTALSVRRRCCREPVPDLEVVDPLVSGKLLLGRGVDEWNHGIPRQILDAQIGSVVIENLLL